MSLQVNPSLQGNRSLHSEQETTHYSFSRRVDDRTVKKYVFALSEDKPVFKVIIMENAFANGTWSTTESLMSIHDAQILVNRLRLLEFIEHTQ